MDDELAFGGDVERVEHLFACVYLGHLSLCPCLPKAPIASPPHRHRSLPVDVDNVIVNDALMLASLLRKKVHTVESLPTFIEHEYSCQ
jgi:hypothetical protein